MRSYYRKMTLYTFMCMYSLLQAQSDNDKELHNRYWTYRENLRKYFTSIGSGVGQGLPFSDIEVQTFARNIKATTSGADIPGTENNQDVMGRMNTGGDVTAYMGEYMGILASEYWLLQSIDFASVLLQYTNLF